MFTSEIEIPVPWGTIACKTWGNEKNCKILLVPGIGDNVESFSGLISLLPQWFFYVAVDLPGHGKSSHFPQNVIFNMWDYIITIRLIIRFLKEDQIILLGHSFGGSLVTIYTQLYPNQISKLILIESSYFYPIEIKHLPLRFDELIEGASELLTRMSTSAPKSFTYNEGLNTMNNTRMHGHVRKESAKKLYERNIIEISDGNYQSRIDPRIKYVPYVFIKTPSQISILKKYPIVCATLSIVAINSKFPSEERKLVATMEKMTRNCVTKFVNGNHNVHSNSPQVIAPLISNFLIHKCHL
ncbi:hypothetical protein RI129_004046 [Pyrocoelia pectoralis]|uniref:AB hydrolase-1 domain-containing protein n=1 Tax=Pyrocoelia pectoralis TaxID=417401 RepID=A0AAN7VSK6_9COLE